MTDEALEPIIEMNRWILRRFKNVVDDMTPDEVDWRPLPQANSINLIVRHLRIEAEWHVAILDRGEPMPLDVPPSLQQSIDSVPLDFDRNLNELNVLYDRFIAVLEGMAPGTLQERTALVYRAFPPGRPAHLLGFHQAVHLAGHVGQISTIRNLYRKTRGEPARFFPENPTFPR
jgi:hypothetical protein